MKYHPLTKLASLFVVCLLTLTSVAFAEEADLTSMVKDMQKQMADLQSTVSMQKAEIQALKTSGAQVQNTSGGVEATPPMSEAEFNQRLSDSTGGANKWLKDLKFSGDLRLRYEAFHLNGERAGSSATANTYEPNRNRFRFRLRFGFEKTFNPEMKVGFSLASGGSSSAYGNADPISTNQTFGNDFTFKNIWIEKAYATYTPEWAKISLADGLSVSGLEVTAGKFNNPFEKGSTDMIWDRDLKPEGIYEKVDVNLLKTDNLTLKAYGTLGQFVLQETGNVASGNGLGSVSGKDANLFAYQVGLNPVFYVPGLERPVDALSALSVYNYQNYAQSQNWYAYPDKTDTSFANGNPFLGAALTAENFNVISLYQEVAFYPYGIPVRPFGEWAHNMSNKAGSTNAAPFANAISGGSDAWSLGLTLGKLVKKGDMQASYQYKYIGANSVPGAFNDSDFGGYNYGGTNKAGNVVKLGYNLTDYLTINGAGYFVSPIATRATTANGAQADQRVSRFQLDMTYKF